MKTIRVRFCSVSVIMLLLTILFWGEPSARASSSVVTKLYTFTGIPDGNAPLAGLVYGLDNAYYGTTPSGGASNSGSIFRINRDGTGYQLILNFDSTVSGSQPMGGLILASNGRLYGTSRFGPLGQGTVYSINRDGSDFQHVHQFTNSAAGNSPRSKLLQASDGMFYGTTFLNGLTNGTGRGSIFKVGLNGESFAVLHCFTNNPDGANPYAEPIQGNDGALYGTTTSGGIYTTNGTIYRINTDGNGYQVLHSFLRSSDGATLNAGLIQGSDGLLYGLCTIGGANSQGTLFKIETNGNNFTVVHHFGALSDGAQPFGTLIKGLGDVFYGTTRFGGTNSNGTIFRFLVGGSNYQTIHSFSAAGSTPQGALVQGSTAGDAGILYGTCSAGGGGVGTVFAALVNPPLNITPISSQVGTNLPVLFWPAWAINYQLQTSTNLNGTNWVTITNGIPLTGIQLTNALDTNGAFFRLHLPP